eukprot:371966-Prymnesium_polylepis.2
MRSGANTARARGHTVRTWIESGPRGAGRTRRARRRGDLVKLGVTSLSDEDEAPDTLGDRVRKPKKAKRLCEPRSEIR